MENKYNTLLAAIKEAETRLDKNQLLEDNSGTKWDTFNLMDQEGIECDDENYYCVGFDGGIGITRDNGYNVEWLYKPV